MASIPTIYLSVKFSQVDSMKKMETKWESPFQTAFCCSFSSLSQPIFSFSEPFFDFANGFENGFVTVLSMKNIKHYIFLRYTNVVSYN